MTLVLGAEHPSRQRARRRRVHPDAGSAPGLARRCSRSTSRRSRMSRANPTASRSRLGAPVKSTGRPVCRTSRSSRSPATRLWASPVLDVLDDEGHHGFTAVKPRLAPARYRRRTEARPDRGGDGTGPRSTDHEQRGAEPADAGVERELGYRPDPEAPSTSYAVAGKRRTEYSRTSWSRRSSCSTSRSSRRAGTTSAPTCRTRRSPCCIRAPASRSAPTISRRSSRWS